MLENIKIVLVRTFHPGNIGSAARAMKTMGLGDLWLVEPKQFPAKEALTMARSAADIVTRATVVESVYEAVQDCRLVMASTVRQRGYDLPSLSPEACAKALLDYAGSEARTEKPDQEHQQGTKVALLFGPERAGLNNADLQFAQYRVSIPTSSAYPSLNMAAAVQILCYEIFKSTLEPMPVATEESPDKRPSIEDLERFYEHLQQALSTSGFIFKKHPGEIMQRLRRLFSRAELTAAEVKILRGILSSFQKKES